MRRSHVLIAATTALALTAAACGDDASSTTSDTTRTIKVEMVDIAYSPTAVQVKEGETVRFEFTNNGKVAHDAFIGDEMAQADHEEEMSRIASSMDGSGMGHGSHGGDSEAITVEPGKTGELEHTFDQAGDYQIGCHEPGHYKAGMKIAVTVT